MAAFFILVGHFYCALFFTLSSLLFFSEVQQFNRDVQKDAVIKMHRLDQFWYLTGCYICFPFAFQRNKIFAIESKTIHLVLFQYHDIVVIALIGIGFLLTIMKLNRGYIKYQIKRQMWSILMLAYMLLLLSVQIYNLYNGYIFVICPIMCLFINSVVKNRIFKGKAYREQLIEAKENKREFQPRNDPIGFAVAFLATGVFAFVASGVMSSYQHLVCKQDELSLRFFEPKTC